MRTWFFRAALVILSPTLFLAAVEGGLRLFGYGYSPNFFVRDDTHRVYRANEKFCWRFYREGIAKAPTPFALPVEKPEGTYRIFILGSSAAWGTPSPSYGFGRVLEKMLRQRHPDVQLEVVNTAIMGINSHIVLPIARECAEHEPDLFVIYLGNNEVGGLYGPPADFMPSVAMIRASLWAKSTRLGQLLGAAIRRGEDQTKQGQDEAFFQAHRAAADDPQRLAVYENFRTNLSDICRATGGARAETIVSTVAVNLKDCPPLGSLHRSDLGPSDLARWNEQYQTAIVAEEVLRYEEAIDHYLAAARLDDRFAELHYRMAECYLAMERFEEARRHFGLACDLDALQFRADSHVNKVIRRVAADWRDRGVELVDAEKALADCDSCEHGIPGESLFYEHVHLKFAGNYQLAKALLPAVEAAMCRRLGKAPPTDTPVASQQQCAAMLALSKWRECQLDTSMVQLTSKPPFTGQFDHAGRQTRAELALKRRQCSFGKQEYLEAVEAYRRAIEQAPDDWLLHYDFAFLLDGHDDAGAAEQMRAVLETMPWHATARLCLGQALVKTGRPDEALAAYQETLRTEPRNVRARIGVGTVMAAQHDYAEAAACFREALRIEPANQEAKAALESLRRFEQGLSGRDNQRSGSSGYVSLTDNVP